MTRDEAVDLLLGRLGKRNSSVTQQDIINEFDFVQTVILEQDATCMYWFLLGETTTPIVTVAGSFEVALPSDFLHEWDDGGPRIEKSDGTEAFLVREPWENAATDFEYSVDIASETGLPKYYDIAGEKYLVRPIPNAVYNINMYYFKAAASLAGEYGDGNNIENSWLKYAADLLLAETGIIIAHQYLQSQTMQTRFEAQRVQARDRLMRKNTAMLESNRFRYMEG